jgi:uncharacterized protein
LGVIIKVFHKYLSLLGVFLMGLYDEYLHIIPYIKELVQQLMGNEFSHGYPHVLRVLNWSYRIVEHEKLRNSIDKFILEASVYLHDLGRLIGEPHAYYSSLIAYGILKQYNVPEPAIALIRNAIEYHSYSYSRMNHVEPMSIEAKILSDADKLDALGIVGFIRVFQYSSLHGRGLKETINHFYEKILRLKEYMHFKYSKTIAEKLTVRIKRLLNELSEELSVEYYV